MSTTSIAVVASLESCLGDEMTRFISGMALCLSKGWLGDETEEPFFIGALSSWSQLLIAAAKPIDQLIYKAVDRR